MANKVTIQGNQFNSQKAAETHFGDIRKRMWKTKEIISSGTVTFDELRELYERYCHCTNWPLPGKTTSFRVKNTGRGVGQSGGTTQCFAVTFDNGAEQEFSADKAIQAIANHK